MALMRAAASAAICLGSFLAVEVDVDSTEEDPASTDVPFCISFPLAAANALASAGFFSEGDADDDAVSALGSATSHFRFLYYINIRVPGSEGTE
jgi:hypothetical protein